MEESKERPTGRSIGTANAEEQNRTADTAVFSRVLYLLSYLGTSNRILAKIRTMSNEKSRKQKHSDALIDNRPRLLHNASL